MSRPLRIEYAGAIYHVTSRGDRREDIYLDDGDRQMWLDVLSQVCARFHWRCHAWCMMDNHYHLIVETIEGNLSRGMRQLNGVYTQKVNRKHKRSGHVFQGRYKAILVEKNSYLMELSRYVVLNPVRAHRVNDVSDWPWSSYLAMIGVQPPPAWLEADGLLGQFGKSRPLAINAYKDFVRAGIGLPAIWGNLTQQMYLGSDEFVEAMQEKLNAAFNGGDIQEVPRVQRRPPAKSLEWYEAQYEQRDSSMIAAYRSGDYTMKAIADWFGVHYATVSRVLKKAEDV
jgi:REP element-mobilizing transposase RayT